MTQRNSKGISTLRDRIKICTMQDVVIDNDRMELSRVSAIESWAGIEQKSGSNFTTEGYAVKPDVEKQTHIITIRTRYDVDYTTAAWIYDQRRLSAPRWFKVLKYTEKMQFTIFSCRIFERSSNAIKPVEQQSQSPMVRSLPDGVRL